MNRHHRTPPFTRRHTTRSVLATIIAASLPGAVSAEAARVTFARGPVAAVSADGTSRAVERGTEVNPGDTIRTGTGRAQLRFTDGAFVSLKPDTDFRVDEYRFEGGRGTGEERGFFSLLRGGLRTITGLIGRARKASYRMRTPVATIGIRGTGYNLDLLTSTSGTQQLKWHVADGTISVQLADGTWLAFAGGGAGTATREQFQQLLLALQQLADEGAVDAVAAEDLLEVFAAGDEVDAGGLAALLAGLEVTQPTKMAPPDCAGAMPGCAIAGAFNFDGDGVFIDGGEGNLVAEFDPASGALTSYRTGEAFRFLIIDDSEAAGFDLGSQGQRGTAASVVDGSAFFSVDPANPDDPRTVATWGRWIAPGTTGGDHPHPEVMTGNDTFAYVISIPPPVTPAAGVGFYTLNGFTPPALNGPGAAALGAAGNPNGTLTADFSNSEVALDMQVPFANGAYQLRSDFSLNTFADGSFRGVGKPFFAGDVTVTGTGVACTETCDGFVSGNVFGPRADGAALGYIVKDFDLSSNVTGAAVFRQTSFDAGDER